MTRIAERLEHLIQQKKKALALFLTAGFPRLDSTVDLVLSLEEAGADIIEIGMPFSDPLADGPTIQKCSAVAMSNGVTLDRIFSMVKSIRSRSAIPLVLMGYVNPLLKYGPGRFFEEAARSGVDGVILPEVPLEEAWRFEKMITLYGLDNILLVAPTSPQARIERIDAGSSGFVYCVSTTGVTGAESGTPALEYVQLVRNHTKKNPLLVGFGISTPYQAGAFAGRSDGVIVGSALLKRMLNGDSTPAVCTWVREMKHAIDQR